MTNYPIYLDYNATTPCDPLVVEAMLPFFGIHFGNAASKTHSYGWLAEESVEIARENVANLINATPNEIVFTSGATESINLAIRGIVEQYNVKETHIITFATEHKAVLDVYYYLQTKGISTTILPVQSDGLPNLEELENAITPNTKLISMMYANNETGVIMPVEQVANIAQKHNIPFFCDATQAVGKIPVDVIDNKIDLMCFSAHKMYGPKGCGALYIRKKTPKLNIQPLLYGGGHERKMRSGTLNVPGIVGFGKACEISKFQLQDESKRILSLRNLLLNHLLEDNNIILNGNLNQLLPNVANILFINPSGTKIIKWLSKHVAISSGSACTSASIEPSHVLIAMGLSENMAANAIRFSLGRYTTEEQIVQTVKYIKEGLAISIKI
ncbi:MAG: aminotransferase class V-fold PLP-dependent enzyme [Chitinophagaceae bacterium]|nr:aminotransferase class V-fold PLP-dependent enzyme [Chitinophagaceae bacterium]